MPKPYQYPELEKVLREFDIQFNYDEIDINAWRAIKFLRNTIG